MTILPKLKIRVSKEAQKHIYDEDIHQITDMLVGINNYIVDKYRGHLKLEMDVYAVTE